MWFTVLITTLISSYFSCWSLYCLSCELPFWLTLWYLQLFLLVIVLPVMWFTVLITPLISSNLSCRLLYSLSCDLPFWLPLWYLQTFLVGHCIACHVIYRSDYHFDIFKLFLLVIVIQWPTRKVWRYQRGNQNGISHDSKYNDQQEKFENIKGVIRTVNHMTGNTITNKKSMKK
jgi:hypothetical protein